jgi:cytochrome bd-type quinol oxidase subunit 2
VYTLALVAAGLIALLCVKALFTARKALRARMSELLVYALMLLGLLVLVGGSSYLAYPTKVAEYAQARYLLPLLPLLAAVLALAARGAGRRWGPAVGTLIIVLFLAHDLFSQLQVVARYYG